MIGYIDRDFCCHIDNPDGNFCEVEHPFFDGKCKEYIEGHRFVPADETWIRSDGAVFHGEMVTPWKPLNELEDAQRVYERQLLVDYAAALQTLGVTV